jgi:hypothetical protein
LFREEEKGEENEDEPWSLCLLQDAKGKNSHNDATKKSEESRSQRFCHTVWVADQINVKINFAYASTEQPEGGQVDVFKERNLVAPASEDSLKEISSANTAIESAALKTLSVNERMKPTESGKELNTLAAFPNEDSK